MWSKKLGSSTHFWIQSFYTCTRINLSSADNDFGTIREHNFHIPKSSWIIKRTVSRFIPRLSESQRIGIRQFATNAFSIHFTFSSFLVVTGFPLRWSSSSDFRPSWHLSTHLYTVAGFMAASPYTVFNFSDICLQVSPSFTRNLITARCLKFLYAFISFTFQDWIRYQSFCSGRTPGALVKTIKYSKFWIILGSDSKNYQIFEISNYFRYSSM